MWRYQSIKDIKTFIGMTLAIVVGTSAVLSKVVTVNAKILAISVSNVKNGKLWINALLERVMKMVMQLQKSMSKNKNSIYTVDVIGTGYVGDAKTVEF